MQRAFGIISKRGFCLCAIKGLAVLQRIGSTQEGKASFILSGDYYNRELSGENNNLVFIYLVYLLILQVFEYVEFLKLQLLDPFKLPNPDPNPSSSQNEQISPQ